MPLSSIRNSDTTITGEELNIIKDLLFVLLYLLPLKFLLRKYFLFLIIIIFKNYLLNILFVDILTK